MDDPGPSGHSPYVVVLAAGALAVVAWRPEQPLLAAVTGVAFALTVFASLLEGAMQEFSWARIEEKVREPERRTQLHGRLSDWDRITDSLAALNLTADIVAVLCLVLVLQPAGAVDGGAAVAWVELAVALGGLLVLGDLLPHVMGRITAEATVLRFLSVLAPLCLLMAPFTAPAHSLKGVFARLFGVKEPPPQHEITDDILSAVEEGERSGILEATRADMIEGVIDLKDADVNEIMTPRTEMVSAPLAGGLDDALEVATRYGHSRVPVYDGNRDNITGILYVKDALKYWSRPPEEVPPLRKLLRKPYFVPETKKVGELLPEFQQRKVHFAVVLDEYGGTAGIVTIEDILEEIVGEISDEYDPEERDGLTWIDDSTAEVDAKLHIDEVNEALGLDIPDDDDYDTVGGFLFASFGKVPLVGDCYDHGPAQFTVVEADDRKINRVKIQLSR